jgi:RNA polymerase-binding transcription factor DksA
MREVSMAEDRLTPLDPLQEKAERTGEMREFIDKQVFAEDERTTSGEISMVSQHEADVAPFTYDRELEQTVRVILDGEAEQIKQAQHRKAQGVYGVCENCGRPIGEARLKALPEATLCIDCQHEREHRLHGT